MKRCDEKIGALVTKSVKIQKDLAEIKSVVGSMQEIPYQR